MRDSSSCTRHCSGRRLGLLALAWLPACSVERYAIDRLGDALAGSGPAFGSDDDPELIRQAVPFGLKLVEGVLEKSPRHERLLLAAARGFTQYAYAFVREDADEIEERSVSKATELRARARKLYLRARGYGLRGLEVAHPGFEADLRSRDAGADSTPVERTKKDREKAVSATTARDVPMLYWTAAAWAGAIDLSKDDPETVADLPLVEAMMDRALALDEGFESGAIHTFLISYESSRPGGAGDAAARARAHFDHAVEISGGRLAAPMVALAEAVSISRQDRGEFESLLNRALAVDVDALPGSRLENLVMQRRARWLLDHVGDHFVE